MSGSMLPLELASGGRGDKPPRALVGLKSPGWSGCGSGTRDDVAIGRTPLQAAMVLLKRCQMHTCIGQMPSIQSQLLPWLSTQSWLPDYSFKIISWYAVELQTIKKTCSQVSLSRNNQNHHMGQIHRRDKLHILRAPLTPTTHIHPFLQTDSICRHGGDTSPYLTMSMNLLQHQDKTWSTLCRFGLSHSWTWVPTTFCQWSDWL